MIYSEDTNYNQRSLKLPGLKIKPEDFSVRLDRLCDLIAIRKLKQRTGNSRWVVLLGGTGTGKSTLFNLMCKAHISSTGIERPKTQGPIIALHAEKQFDFSGIGFVTEHKLPAPSTGSKELFILVSHHNDNFKNVVFVDTPDLDSLFKSHHRTAQNMFYLADVAVFILSEEKYADLKLINHLSDFAIKNQRIIVVVNKVTHSESIVQDLEAMLLDKGIRKYISELVIIPYAEKELPDKAGDNLKKALIKVVETSGENSESILDRKIKTMQLELDKILKEETKELQFIKEAINSHAERAYSKMLETHTKDISASTKAMLNDRIKNMYSRYDILSGVRKFVRSIITFPAKIINPSEKHLKKTSDAETLNPCDQIDLSVISGAIYDLTRNIYEIMDEYPDSPLAREIKNTKNILTREEIQSIGQEKLKELFEWLEEEFENLGKGLPKIKEVSIYSTMVLWAIFLLSIEASIGGGISFFDAALDSVLAPFISKGTVEWFAKKDIHRIGGELIRRHRKNLKTIIEMQKERFLNIINAYEITLAKVDSISALCR